MAMSRPVRFALAALASLLLVGCATSEIKNTNPIGLSDGTPTATVESGYGDGKGDSVGGGGAAPARAANDTSVTHEEHK
jgi:hypothetical protein